MAKREGLVTAKRRPLVGIDLNYQHMWLPSMQPDAIEIPEKLYRRLQNALDDLDEAADRISAYVEKKRLL